MLALALGNALLALVKRRGGIATLYLYLFLGSTLLAPCFMRPSPRKGPAYRQQSDAHDRYQPVFQQDAPVEAVEQALLCETR